MVGGGAGAKRLDERMKVSRGRVAVDTHYLRRVGSRFIHLERITSFLSNKGDYYVTSYHAFARHMDRYTKVYLYQTVDGRFYLFSEYSP